MFKNRTLVDMYFSCFVLIQVLKISCMNMEETVAALSFDITDNTQFLFSVNTAKWRFIWGVCQQMSGYILKLVKNVLLHIVL